MATTYLINSTRVGTLFLHAGTLIDDTQVDVAALATAGGRTWPSTDATVAAAAARCIALRGQGQSGAVLDDIMEAAVAASINTGGTTTGAKNIGVLDAGLLLAAANVEDALAEVAAQIFHTARVVITSIAAYVGTTTGVLTASANGAIGAQDGATLTAGQIVFLPKVTGGAGGTTAAADVGPWVVTNPGGASAKFVLTRPAWWTHGAAIPQASTIVIAEGTVWAATTWRSTCAAGLVIDTGDPLFYPDVQKGTGAVGTQVTGVFAMAAASVSANDTTAAAAVKPTLVAGNGSGTLDFVGTGTDAVKWCVTNF